MTGDTADYVHGYASAEQERLFVQAEHWRDELILDGTTLAPGTMGWTIHKSQAVS